jgi:hypothetical protein
MARRTPESRQLSTTSAVLSALGPAGADLPAAIHAVAALTGADWRNVHGWQRAETFPSRYFLVMWFALWRRGYSAPPELWSQVTPGQRKLALREMIAATQKRAA